MTHSVAPSARPSADVDKFIFDEDLLLVSEEGAKPLDDHVSGMALTKLNQAMLNSIPVFLPKTLEEQRAIVGRLEALSSETGRLEEIYQQKVDALEELKKSVLAKSFAGEL